MYNCAKHGSVVVIIILETTVTFCYLIHGLFIILINNLDETVMPSLQTKRLQKSRGQRTNKNKLMLTRSYVTGMKIKLSNRANPE